MIPYHVKKLDLVFHTLLENDIDRLVVHPAYYRMQNGATLSISLWILEVTNLTEETNEFHRAFPKALSAIGVNDFLVKVYFHVLLSPILN